MRTTKRSKFVALAVGLALVAAACGDDKESTTTNAPETTAGEVTETTAGEVTETTAGEVTETTVASEEPAMTISYNLSDTAVWEDGSEIGLADFQCTQDAIMNTPGSLSTTGYDQVIGIAEGATPKDIVVTLKSQYAPWKGLFSGLLKAANFEDCNDVSESFDAGIPFSGREWQIDSWSAEQLVLVPNPGYTGSKVPGVERIVVVPAEDGPTALKAGAVDFIFPQAYTGIDQELADPNVEYDTALSGAFEGFYFQSYEGPFANPDFRAAFSMSIDRDAIYEQIYAPFAQGTPLLNCGPIAPGPYCNDAFADTYDLAGAETVLTDAGWTKNADGMWADADGNVPEIRWMVNTGNTRRESTQEFLIPKLAEAGFNVKADNCEALPCVFETRLPSLDYDMAMYINTVAPDPAYLRTWGCDQIPTEENDFQGQNSNGWCNEEATTQLIAADAELDEAKRIEEVQKAISLMAEDHIMLPLLQFPNVGAIRTDRLANAYGELANYRAINDWYQWTDVDGDGQIIIGAEQFPAADCPNPITECSNSSWYVWLISFPVLPGVYDTTNDQTFEPSEMLTGEATIEVL
ncbi:MAG TPA: ABC transporter substrate-binding protein [Ilumatobacteraceae bacterium]|nr:ABC transporter substrate-binding protein [Ilumatobacteraceae bacterium]